MSEATAEIGKKKNRENMKDDDEELEMLSDEIPHATSHNHHHHYHQLKRDNNHVNGSIHAMYGLMYDDDTSSHYYKHTCASPVSGFSLRSDGSSSSLFSNNGQSLSGSPTPPPLEDLKPPQLPNGMLLDSAVRKKASIDSLNGELGLYTNISKMYISNDQQNVASSFRDFSLKSDGIQVNDHINVQKYGACDKMRRGFSDFVGIQSPVPMSVPLSFHGGMNMAFSGLPQQEYGMNNLMRSLLYLGCSDALISQQGMNCWNSAMRSPWQNKERTCSYHGGNFISHLSTSFSKVSVNDALMCCMSLNEERRNARTPYGGLDAITSEDGAIIQGEGLNYVINKGFDYSRRPSKGSLQESCVDKSLGRRPQLDGQHGCRFLQRLFDEGTQQEVLIIFEEITDHVVELMMNPFGNYLMQKLLEACNEEQRMQILLMITEEPGQLVKISLNTHGTRVVQKLIETLKTRQQISLVVSSLEPGFLSLVKDLNGNHVVQHCLQCLSSEDNNFIFVAAAKYCVDIATHQHGCCLLQRCINHSTGEYREKLAKEISTNGLLLVQDAYGNYVVQFILELKIPSATSTLISQFEGNYVHLSSQKFSSYVVEKCLVVLNDGNRSRIIHELLSAAHFE
ncbi:hypothetical protein PTKIN_Ptkin02bG0149100 [Pterospermum kingtungense]